MDEPPESLSKKVISYILPAACGIILGYIFYRGKIFQPHMTPFQFVIISVEASILIASLIGVGLGAGILINDILTSRLKEKEDEEIDTEEE